MSALENFEKMLAAGKDNLLLRYSLGNEYFKLGDFAAARAHLEAALVFDPRHSAAWKLLGKTLVESGALADALVVYQRGIAAAEEKGDLQAVKEMRVFAHRVEKQLAEPTA
ncbi:tetratricopeptide repeat protein [Rhodoferax sp.]|uniref:tetratricopeptide repeat protein n=1 Tax=Rhodoferax sp. TaxID=50421 RepID=UPI0027320ADB|nr:tetratricopeptide repeat protein [Rhodoferax sp.]MDP2443350.1 tetratricopeptide repeat protein [Rhodoferax sp.]